MQLNDGRIINTSQNQYLGLMEDNLPLILITNDDGITAPGIRTLVECVMHLGTRCSCCS